MRSMTFTNTTNPTPISSTTSIALTGAVLIGGVWVLAAIFSAQPILESMLLVVLQIVLAFTALLFGARALSKPSTPEGPGIVFFLAIHVLIYYGFANVVPALLSDIRPEYIQAMVGYRIPPSNTISYILGTVAALSMLCGLIGGAWVARKLLPLKVPARRHCIRKYQWLPRYRLLMIASGTTLTLLLLGTATYGIRYDILISDDEIASLSLGMQLFFHSLIYCLAIPPVLAAGAYVQAFSIRQRKTAGWLTIASILVTVAALSIWRMRSHSMIAFALPVALIVYTGMINWRRLLLPGLAIIVMIYFGVSFVRMSGFVGLISETNSIAEVNISEAVSAVFTEPGRKLVSEVAMGDASYRTAGLEGVAALIQAQNNGQLELQWGNTIYSGFLQALPAALRPSLEVSERIKTAPSYFGIFSPGDWVTTLLAEFVLDFGFILVFFPALFGGFFLCALDRILLLLGQLSAFEGLLVLRIPFFLFIVSNGGSLSDMSLMFFKATTGYALLLLLISWASRLSGRRISALSIIPEHNRSYLNG